MFKGKFSNKRKAESDVPDNDDDDLDAMNITFDEEYDIEKDGDDVEEGEAEGTQSSVLTDNSSKKKTVKTIALIVLPVVIVSITFPLYFSQTDTETLEFNNDEIKSMMSMPKTQAVKTEAIEKITTDTIKATKEAERSVIHKQNISKQEKKSIVSLIKKDPVKAVEKIKDPIGMKIPIQLLNKEIGAEYKRYLDQTLDPMNMKTMSQVSKEAFAKNMAISKTIMNEYIGYSELRQKFDQVVKQTNAELASKQPNVMNAQMTKMKADLETRMGRIVKEVDNSNSLLNRKINKLAGSVESRSAETLTQLSSLGKKMDNQSVKNSALAEKRAMDNIQILKKKQSVKLKPKHEEGAFISKQNGQYFISYYDSKGLTKLYSGGKYKNDKIVKVYFNAVKVRTKSGRTRIIPLASAMEDETVYSTMDSPASSPGSLGNTITGETGEVEIVIGKELQARDLATSDSKSDEYNNQDRGSQLNGTLPQSSMSELQRRMRRLSGN
ncbi:MAG: hypothetical protein HOG49_01250 [Candidatus Scalindua sp.]|nr:hypothetical protein [Candidatus Scalindua sp.]